MENTERYIKEPSKEGEYRKLSERFNFFIKSNDEYVIERSLFEKPFCLINYSKPRMVTVIYDDDVVVLTDVF